jgi:GNAT superfamily N-acetyltransferase
MNQQTNAAALHCVVRTAQAEDCNKMADLAVQLGYECTEEEVHRRLGEMQNSHQYAIFVADLAGCQVVGWVAAFVFRAVELDTFAEISGLIVDQAHRCGGIGKLLLDAAENWARHVGCSAISVHSNIIRDRAHRFYRDNGFELMKTQRIFHKPLIGPAREHVDL